jgi:hypothetical protein
VVILGRNPDRVRVAVEAIHHWIADGLSMARLVVGDVILASFVNSLLAKPICRGLTRLLRASPSRISPRQPSPSSWPSSTFVMRVLSAEALEFQPPATAPERARSFRCNEGRAVLQ